MQRTSFTRLQDRQGGFTLVEVLAVMAIVALAASLAVFHFVGTGGPGIRALAMRAAAVVRGARLQAEISGSNTEVYFDPSAKALIGTGGARVTLPADVTVDILTAAGQLREGVSLVRFAPDGSSSGGILRLSREERSYEVWINWYTGATRLVSVETP